MIRQAEKSIWVRYAVCVCQMSLDPFNTCFFIALEYMEGGEIEWRDENEMPVLSIDEARSVFRDVVSGLDYCKCILDHV